MGFFWSGPRASSNNVFTREGSFPLCLLEKGDEIANLVDSSLMKRKTERPLLSRANTGSSLAKDLGVVVLAFPHLKIDRHLVVRKTCVRDRPTPQIDRHHLVRERGG